jgi:hypothetical protein
VSYDIDHGLALDAVELVQRLEVRRAIHLDVAADEVWKPSTPLVLCKLARWHRKDLIQFLQAHLVNDRRRQFRLNDPIHKNQD